MKQLRWLAFYFFLFGLIDISHAGSHRQATNGPTAVFTLHINGPGAVTPDYDGQLLQIGTKYRLKAKPAKGCGFVGWTITGTSNNFTSRSFTLGFIMQSNLTVSVTFKDISPPLDIITSPALHQNFTNGVITAEGKASDNIGVTDVSCQVNGGGWTHATSTNGWTNWTASATLLSGANVIESYSVDGQGWNSPTVSVTFNHTIEPAADWAPDSVNGLAAQIVPNGGSPISASFDLFYFNQTGASNNDFQVGSYVYSKNDADTNLAELSLHPFDPQSAGSTTLELTFTNHYSGTYTNAPGQAARSVTNEEHVLSFDTPATLDYANVVAGSIAITNESSTNAFYMNGADYIVTTNNEFTLLLLTTNSAIADGATVHVSYNWTETIYYTNSGAFSFEVANALVPASIPIGHTLFVANSAGVDKIKFLKNGGFTRTHPDKTKDSGSFTFARTAPDAALLELVYGTNLLDDVELTFQSPSTGPASTYSFSYSWFFGYTYTPLNTNYGSFHIK